MSEQELQRRINKALELVSLGSFDGSHHKMYALDQVLRALTGCPMITETAKDYKGRVYTFDAQGESQEYLDWVKDFEYEGGEQVTEWDVGTPP